MTFLETEVKMQTGVYFVLVSTVVQIIKYPGFIRMTLYNVQSALSVELYCVVKTRRIYF